MPPQGPDSPFEPELQRLDLEALRRIALHRLRARLQGFDAAEIENAAQEVLLGLTQVVRRSGIRTSAEAIVVQIARNVAADMIGKRRRERGLQQALQGDSAPFRPDPEQEEEILEAVRRMAFFVKEYYRLRRAGCLPLAEAKQRGESLKAFALAQGLPYDKVRQDWSRCAKLIHDAIRMGRLRLDWPRTDQRRRRHG